MGFYSSEDFHSVEQINIFFNLLQNHCVFMQVWSDMCVWKNQQIKLQIGPLSNCILFSHKRGNQVEQDSIQVD